MIIISNAQRDQVVRYLNVLCGILNDKDTKSYNIKRLSRKLIVQLEAKCPIRDESGNRTDD